MGLDAVACAAALHLHAHKDIVCGKAWLWNIVDSILLGVWLLQRLQLDRCLHDGLLGLAVEGATADDISHDTTFLRRHELQGGIVLALQYEPSFLALGLVAGVGDEA